MSKHLLSQKRFYTTSIILLSLAGLFFSLFYSQLVIANTATQVESVRLWRAPDHTRVVFDLSGAVEHKLFPLQNPSRLVVDLSRAINRATLNDLEFQKTPISRIRSAKREDGGLRFVFDLNSKTNPRSFFLKKDAGKPNRLVIDFYDPSTITEKTIEKVAVAAEASSRRDILIVVDAGHGGEDPGAIGPNKLKEKYVVLDIAKKLANKINRTEGYIAKLTRTNDYYVPLKKRRDFARKNRADLFVSIHADAFDRPAASGASVFALSLRGATSERARFLARKENKADLIGGVGDVSLLDKDDTLKSVLVDLSMSATLTSSLDAGKHILEEMDDIAKLHKKSVEQANFLVLKSADVPSILVETGFISNPKEAKKLSTGNYREKMASSIFAGVRAFFEKNPPADTYIAWKQKGGKENTAGFYKVSSGDTLSGIADRFKVSVNELKRLNKLSTNDIRIGQTLRLRSSKIVSNPVAIPTAGSSRVHKVKSGESLLGIALHYDMTMSDLKRINKLSKDSIKIGQVLTIDNVSVQNETVPIDSNLFSQDTKSRHKVTNGETLSGIAYRYGMSTSELKKLNDLSSNSIRIGQVLLVRSEKTVAKAKVIEKKRVHKVRNGDTLSGIALRYSSSVSEIKKYNNLDGSSLQIGQKLVIPSAEG